MSVEGMAFEFAAFNDISEVDAMAILKGLGALYDE